LDRVTASASLQYKVVYASTSAAIDTVAEADAIANIAMVWTSNTTAYNVTGLSSYTTFYFAVLVKDAVGNTNLYSPVSFTTLDGTAISFSGTSASGTTVSWGAASDDVTVSASLLYKVVQASLGTAIDTVSEANAITTAGAGLVMDWTANTTSSAVTGLASSTTYYFNVLVKDAAGNVSCYTPAAQATISTGWVQQTSGVSTELDSVSLVDANNGWVVGVSAVILHTTNGGTTWAAQTSGLSSPLNKLSGVKFINSTTGLICASRNTATTPTGYVLKTTDGGSTWNQMISFTDRNVYGISMSDASNAWIARGYGVTTDTDQIIASTDGGSAWSAQTTGVTQTLRTVQAVSGSVMYAGGGLNGTMGIVIKTTDGGANWTIVLDSGTTTSLICLLSFINASTGWVVGNGGIIYKTTDGGTNWTAQTSGTAVTLTGVCFVDANNGWAVGNTGTILRTVNGGTTWTTETCPVTTNLTGVSFVNATNGWITGASGVILKGSY
jgi:photosystem II stability/assembly factor-like uncharacterized protein